MTIASAIFGKSEMAPFIIFSPLFQAFDKSIPTTPPGWYRS
jgi:hypothetical protein